MAEPLLILRLEGVLQSWGEDAKWDTRSTALTPSKSGIVGLLACAMGLERGDPQIAALSDAMKLGIRADRPGIQTTDYHTVQGHPLRNAAGKPRSNGNTLISRRQYLQDASFLVVIQVDDAWRERMVWALRSPKWCIYLGRKSCVPSRPVFETVSTEYRDILDALSRYPAADRAQYPLSYECEINQETAESYSRSDAVVSGGDRRFAMRTVWRGSVKEAAHVPDEN